MRTRTLIGVGILLLSSIASEPLAAIAPMSVPAVPLVPLHSGHPAAASLRTPQSRRLASQLSPLPQMPGHWLLILVTPDSPSSKMLLGLLSNIPPEYEASSRVVIVVGGRDMDRAADLKDLYPGLSGFSWFADPARAMQAGFNLKESPVAIGVRDGKSSWSVSGMIKNPAFERNAILTWIAPRAPSPRPPEPTAK